MTPENLATFWVFSSVGMPRPEAKAYLGALLKTGELWELPTAYLDMAAELLFPDSPEYIIN